MSGLKTLGSIALSTLLIVTVPPPKGFTKQEPKSQKAKAAVLEKGKPASGQMKVLAEGFHSAVTHPFVAVLRDQRTYQDLRKLDGSLPPLDKDFFEASVVVAAFLGERNTGGYAVEFTREVGGEIHIGEKKPGKGMMVTQMITSPFKIVVIEGSPNARVPLSLDLAWLHRAQTYRVTSGTFTYSGGFAGKSETFALKGRVLALREEKLVSLLFDISSSDARETRSLADSTTGVVTADGGIASARMSAWSLVPPPNGGLQVSGMLSDEGKKLLLQFASMPTNIADGYGGCGSIEAELGASINFGASGRYRTGSGSDRVRQFKLSL